jgi:hypothetical protein
MGIQDKYDALNPSERDFVCWHPFAAVDFNSNAEVALKEAQRRFGAATLHNGSGDAFRHCFWSAMNARDQGKELAKAFGDAHEDWSGNPANEKTMDLHNNGIGFTIGAGIPGASDRHLAVLCVDAWASGKLIQLDPKNGTDLIYSSPYETKIYKPLNP